MRTSLESRQRSERGNTPPDPARARIIEAASRQFFSQGFRRASMDDLAAELGMSKKTLYSRFDTKLQLVEAVIENKFRRAREDMTAIMAGDGNFPETMREYLDCIQRHMAELQPPFIRDMRQEGMEIFQRVERMRQGIIEEFFGELMRRGRRAGYIRKDIPAQIIIEILLGAVRAIINPSRIEDLGLTPKAACAIITKVVLEGAADPASKTNFKC